MTRERFIAWVPNLITLARLLSVPVAVYVILQDYYAAAFWIFLIAGLSDAVDGLLAKHYKVTSLVGSFLDPLADKALLMGVYVALGSLGHISLWLVILIVFRDLLIIGGALLFQTLTHSLKMEPLFISKVNTAAQIALAGFVLARLGIGADEGWLEPVLVCTVAATTLASGAAYVVKWGRRAVTYEGDR
ncbi:MAG: CDP-alcohol phosphatidyltransferase family protein [Kiloniellales bacterium]|nr:CDP-alcohol phosphatidyltransferase family protein [Kiloniellales bacterium]